ncbi:MAG TPA: AMP-binding protein, partial [Gemmatimonadaceae bacterium]|nr:AMP-binding protein [Gemmatimonadaceae bacterium]
MARSAHVDTFARDHLPPASMWPPMDYSVRPELWYSEQLNCAAELLDRNVMEGRGDRIAVKSPSVMWSYRDLLERSNRIANVLVKDLGIRPGNRVLLRGANSPMLAACWFAVLKAGGICVATMPLLRARELSYIIDKAQIALA